MSHRSHAKKEKKSSKNVKVIARYWVWPVIKQRNWVMKNL